LPESTYEHCLVPELKLNGIACRLRHPQPVEYRRFVLSPFVLFVSFVVRAIRNPNNGMQADARTSRHGCRAPAGPAVAPPFVVRSQRRTA
jgi:hypothetical protein